MPGTRSTSLPSGGVQTPNGQVPHQDSPARPPRPAAPRRGGCGFDAAAALDCRIRIVGRAATDPPNRRPPQARGAHALQNRLTTVGSRFRTRCSGAATRQGSRPARDPRGRRHRLGVLVCVEAHPHACRGRSTTISADSFTIAPPAQPPRSTTARRTMPSQRHRPPADPFRSPSCPAPYPPNPITPD